MNPNIPPGIDQMANPTESSSIPGPQSGTGTHTGTNTTFPIAPFAAAPTFAPTGLSTTPNTLQSPLPTLPPSGLSTSTSLPTPQPLASPNAATPFTVPVLQSPRLQPQATLSAQSPASVATHVAPSAATPATAPVVPESSFPTNVQMSRPSQPHANGTAVGAMPSSPPSLPLDTTMVDRIVLEYLRKRGFKAAENALSREVGPDANKPSNVDASSLALTDADVDDDLRSVLMLLQNPSDLVEADVLRYEESFRELLDWVDGSLDIYKPQLHVVLYPLLVHSFIEIIRRDYPKEARRFLEQFSPQFSDGALTDSDGISRQPEIVSLKSVGSSQHLEENETAKLYLAYRYDIYLSHYAFELLMSFLTDDPRRTVLLRILNQRCRIHLDASTDGPPVWSGGLWKENGDGKRKVVGLVPDDERNNLPSGQILWGRLKPEHYIVNDEEMNSKGSWTGKGKAKSSSADPKLKGGSGDKYKGDTNKKDTAMADEEEEATVLEDGTISRSRVPLKRYAIGAASIDSPSDIKSRATLRVADAVNGIRKDLSILFYTFVNTRDEGLNTCMVSEDGSQVAAGFGDSSVRFWDAKATGTSGSGAGGLDGKPVRLIGHSGPVYAVDWSKCSRYLLSASGDGNIRLWSANLKADLVAYVGHNFPVWCTQFSPLDHYFASGSHDRTARIWTTDRVNPLRVLAGHLADVDVVRWHPNCNYVATGSSDRNARLWDIRDGSCARIIRGSGPIYTLAFSPDGTTIAGAGDGRSIDVWDLRKGEKLRELRGHESTVWSLDYSRDGSVLASGGADHVVSVWRAEDWCTPVTVDIAAMNGVENGGTGSKSGDPVVDSNGIKTDIVVDGDGDVNMDGSGTYGMRKENTTTGGSSKKEKVARKGIADDKYDHNGVPLVEKFRTKQTPVQMVKFTRKNILIAAGSFGL